MAARAKICGAVCGALLLFSHSRTRAHAPTRTHQCTLTLYCFNAQLRRFFLLYFRYFFLYFLVFSFSKWKTFVAPLTSFYTDVNCGSDSNRWLRHFLKNCNSILLLFVCSVCCSNWNLGGLQHAAGFHLKLTVVVAQCAQWSFVTVIPVHFLVVLDQFVCVYLNSANNTTQEQQQWHGPRH